MTIMSTITIYTHAEDCYMEPTTLAHRPWLHVRNKFVSH